MTETFDDAKSEIQRKGEQLYWVALLETLTYAILFYFWQIADSSAGTRLMGWAHGWVVMAFAVMVFWITPGIKWKWWVPVVGMLGPVGAGWIAHKLRRTDWDEVDAAVRADRAATRANSQSLVPSVEEPRPTE